jgi:Tol biopolymer transport system component
MNNKVKSEKFRKLSIAALITGILAYGNVFLFFVYVGPFVNSYLKNFIFIPDEIYIIFLVTFLVICLPVPAIVCGSIDLKRSKAGLFRNKVFKGMDIAGIVLGSFLILIVLVFFLGETIAPGRPVTNYEPAWSPDGTRIAFTSEKQYIATIWAMDADGSNQTKLTYGYTHSSAWSPDSTKIFFIGSGGAYDGIYVIDSDGSNQKRLFGIAGEYKYLAWSPDGIKIAFASLSSGNADIWVMDGDGSNQTNITNSSSDDYSPAWSPDGTKIAFESEQLGNADIWVMDGDGSNQTNITNSATGDYDPAWSPDGTKIAFVSEPESRSFIEWLSATEEDTKVRVFGWSEQQGNTDIWVMDADGSNQIRLTETEAWDGHPAWSPDGTKIVFTSHRDGVAQIYVMDADGSNQTRLPK